MLLVREKTAPIHIHRTAALTKPVEEESEGKGNITQTAIPAEGGMDKKKETTDETMFVVGLLCSSASRAPWEDYWSPWHSLDNYRTL